MLTLGMFTFAFASLTGCVCWACKNEEDGGL
ncbi:MAG: hypothetical protein QOD99_2153 [Chthoniobacter sp.]|jgi:hypothetical protein|nr:hypothetical protein [Chthoniobacter sp.]